MFSNTSYARVTFYDGTSVELKRSRSDNEVRLLDVRGNAVMTAHHSHQKATEEFERIIRKKNEEGFPV